MTNNTAAEVPRDSLEDALTEFKAKRVPKAWRVGTQPGERFYRQCFRKAYEYAELHQDLKGLYIVHTNDNSGLCHGWVELPRGIVFCGVYQEFYDKDAYERVWMVEPAYKYLWCAASLIRLILSMRLHKGELSQDGGWADLLNLPHVEGPPVIIDSARAYALFEEAFPGPGPKPKSPRRRRPPPPR